MTLAKFSPFSLYFIFLVSCQTDIGRQHPEKSKQLYSEGMKILEYRISIQSADKEKALMFNKKAIEKFSDAYKADTSFAEPVLFASECTMFARDYQNCVYWTSKLMLLDTSQRNLIFCNGRIGYCNSHLRSIKEK